jgi:GT2 family glycosyltransferase
MIDLSIVIPTLNRAGCLERAIAAIPAATQATAELIVVDGGSTDVTGDLLARATQAMGSRLQVIREPQREGFVRAVNRGFRAARGKFVTWINDDAWPLAGAYDRAIELLSFAPRTVGMAALFHSTRAQRSIAFEAQHLGRPFRVLHVRGTLYANFGVAPRTLFERLGYFDERYFLYGADPDFSLKVWNAGLSVVPAFGALLDHEELQDDRREADRGRSAEDNEKLFAKWDLPPRNDEQNDFDQTRPCTLRGPRTAQAA